MRLPTAVFLFALNGGNEMIFKVIGIAVVAVIAILLLKLIF